MEMAKAGSIREENKYTIIVFDYIFLTKVNVKPINDIKFNNFVLGYFRKLLYSKYLLKLMFVGDKVIYILGPI
jgi:hypothetical protein